MNNLIKLLIGKKQVQPLTFTAVQANSTVKLNVAGTLTLSTIKYNVGNGWLPYTINTTITLTNIGDQVQFKNTINSLSTGTSNYARFEMTGQINASGNCMSLLNYVKVCPNLCFANLFNGCTSLITPPEILCTTLGSSCFYQMFRGCTSLTKVPKLQAETATHTCYNYMFYGCSSLTTIPEDLLPATTLNTSCYLGMFANCSNLTNVCNLPATTLAANCYQYMFSGCTSLSGISELSATRLANSCYREMFSNCSSLKEAPELPATTLGAACYYGMFSNCSSLKDMPVISANLITGTSNFGFMFASCTSLTGTVDLLPTYLFGANYDSMFVNCSSLEIAPHIHLSGIQVPQSNMFYNCSNLKEINVDAVTWDNVNTQNWLYNNQTSGTFYCPLELSIPSRDVNGVPPTWNVVRKLAYIESTGTQYIDTGIKPDFANGDKIEIQYFKGEIGTNICLFGSRQPPALNGFYVLGSIIVLCDNDNFTGIPDGDLGSFTLSVDNEYIRLNSKIISMSKRVTCAYPMYLFALNNGGYSFGYFPSMKLYDWKYYRNGVLAQHLIPVLDQNDVPCLYDTVSGNFYYNAGTGTFNYN